MKKRWNDKRYYSLDYYLKETFGEKVYKIALSGSKTCPNRDGTLGTKGCIFCSEGGSGDFAQNASLSVTEQIASGKKLLKEKYTGNKFIAYFQSYTGTYAPIDYLEKIFFEAIENDDIVALSIATRPDCLGDEVIDLLYRLNQIKPVWVELGLQSIHESTAAFIRRGYDLSCFETALTKLKSIGVLTIVHAIIGLPFETEDMIIETIDYLAHKKIDGIKLQLLHILKYTELADLYNDNFFKALSLEEYTDIVVRCIEHLPANMVIHRITGDGPKNILIAPTWSLNKKLVLNTINKKLKQKNTYQGRFFIPN